MAGSTPTPAACRTCGQSFRDDVLICPGDGSHLPLEGRLLDGKFRLDKRLGHGGMATVWQATNEFIERPVAIKLMHTSYAADADLLARFRNEATAAGRIGSSHICDVLDFGRSVIGPYIVMELLSGCSLSDLIQAYRRLDPGLAVWIVRQALGGLEAAHRAGIVHRDLKPENIYLCRAIRDQWLVKLMDFGISKFTDSLRTGAGTMMGSPNYMAPEQIHGAAAVDARADVWSIGAILYEALAGEQAFARDSIADSLAAVRNFDPPRIHTLAPEVSPGLSAIVARCLRKQPDQRWPSAVALSEALLPYQRPNPRTRDLPTPAMGIPHMVHTMVKSGAVPRPAVDTERRIPTGSHQSVARGRSASTAHAGNPSVAQAPVPKAIASTTSGPHKHVPRATSTSGPHKPVPHAISSVTSGPHHPVSRAPSATPTSGPYKPVPKAIPRRPPRAAAAQGHVSSGSHRIAPARPAAGPGPAPSRAPQPLILALVLALLTAAAIAWLALTLI